MYVGMYTRITCAKDSQHDDTIMYNLQHPDKSDFLSSVYTMRATLLFKKIGSRAETKERDSSRH